MSDASPESNGLPENIASTLCYLFGAISGLVFFLTEKKNETVRYHAVQSIIVTVIIIVVFIVIGIVSYILGLVPAVGGVLALLLTLVVNLACFAAWVGLMVLAFTGRKIALPIISELAEKYSKPGAV